MTDIFKALGDETRLRIVSLVLKEEACVCEIEKILNLTQSNASRHLGVLKRAGIIKARKEAQWVFFSIDEKFITDNNLLYNYLMDKYKNINLYVTDNSNCKLLKEKTECCKEIRNGKN